SGLHDRADDGLPTRDQEGHSPREEDRQRAYLRGGHLAERGATASHRRPAEFLRRPEPAGHGASDRIRQFDARRRQRGRAGLEEVEEEQGQGNMTTGILNHLLQSTAFALACALLTLMLRQN